MTLEGISSSGCRTCALRSPEKRWEFNIAPKGGEVARRFLQKKMSGKPEWPRRSHSPSLDAWLLERDEEEAATVSKTAHCNRMAMEQRSPPPPPRLNGSERKAAAVLRRTGGSPHHGHSGDGAIADHEGVESAAAANTTAKQSPASDPAGELGMLGILDELELLIIQSRNDEMIARFFITLDIA